MVLQGHVTNKNHYISNTRCLWPPNITGWYLTSMGYYLYRHKSLWSHDHLTNQNHYIWNITVPLATKIGRSATYFKRLPPIKLFHSMVPCFCSITWQAETITSSPLQCSPINCMTLQGSGHASSFDNWNTFYLHL